MARAFLLCHGSRVDGRDYTFVPEGRTISFYSEFDENTLRSTGLAALNAGDITPNETYEAGDPIPNYSLSRFNDSEMAQHLAVESSLTDGTLYFLGQDPFTSERSALCTTPQACAATAPHHAQGCRGVFNLITEEDIYSVSCRGVSGQQNQATRVMEGSTEFNDELREMARAILQQKQDDPDAAIQYFLSLPQGTQQMMMSYVAIKDWVNDYFKQGGEAPAAAVIEARSFLAANGDIAFVDYAEQFEFEQRTMVLAEDDLLAAWWTGFGRRLLRNEGAPAFYEFYRTLDPYWLDVLAQDDELASAIGQGSQGADLAQAPTWAPSQDDFDEARSINEPFVKDLDEDVDAAWEVGAAVVLFGQPSGELASRVRQQPDYASGTFRVERAIFGAGSLRFSGVPPVLQDTVTWTVNQFSKKDVEFD
jgi:hypothetical protein